MRKFSSVLLLTLFFSLTGVSLHAQNNIIDEVVWVVGDEAILKSQVEEKTEAYRRINRSKSTLFIFTGRRCEDGCFSY